MADRHHKISKITYEIHLVFKLQLIQERLFLTFSQKTRKPWAMHGGLWNVEYHLYFHTDYVHELLHEMIALVSDSKQLESCFFKDNDSSIPPPPQLSNSYEHPEKTVAIMEDKTRFASSN